MSSSYARDWGLALIGALIGTVATSSVWQIDASNAEKNHQAELAQVATDAVVRGFCNAEPCNGTITVNYSAPPGQSKDFTLIYRVRDGKLFDKLGQPERLPLPRACTGFAEKGRIDTAGVCSFVRDGGKNH